MKQLALYTLLRLGLLAVAFGVLYLVFGRWVNVWAIALLSVLVTGVLSMLFLRSQTARAGEALNRVIGAIGERYRAARAAEDEDDDDEYVLPPHARGVDRARPADGRPGHQPDRNDPPG